MQYLADTPDGAWAEFLRHEGITTADQLNGVARAIWAVEVPVETIDAATRPTLPRETLVGNPETYEACRHEARRIRRAAAPALRTPTAALVAGGAHGWRVEAGLRPGSAHDGEVIVLFGARPDLVGWPVVERGQPGPELLDRVRPFNG